VLRGSNVYRARQIRLGNGDTAPRLPVQLAAELLRLDATVERLEAAAAARTEE
jgi:uncharacterized protein